MLPSGRFRYSIIDSQNIFQLLPSAETVEQLWYFYQGTFDEDFDWESDWADSPSASLRNKASLRGLLTKMINDLLT